MAKTKSNPVTEAPSSPAAEVVNGAAGVDANAAPAKEKKSATSYEVVSLPSNRDRLSPQLRALVDTIDTCTQDINGKKIVFRAEIFTKWTLAIGSESGDKVFASYMHQLLSFAFLDRVDAGTSKPKKVISPMERKQKLLDMLAKLPEADRKELLASMGAA